MEKLALDTSSGLCWCFKPEDVEAELQRQDRKTVDIKFCLTWCQKADEDGVALVDTERPHATGPLTEIRNTQTLLALVHFMLLENIGLFTTDGRPTVFGAALSKVPEEFQEDALFVLEMMKFGLLVPDELMQAPDRPFPERIRLFRYNHSPDRKRAFLLLTRVFSLVPMQLKGNDFWGADVDFDLAAFHCLLKVLKRSLRQITEASIGSLLLHDVSKIKLVPQAYMNPTAPSVPCFMLPRNCLGIVFKHVLESELEPESVLNGSADTENGPLSSGPDASTASGRPSSVKGSSANASAAHAPPSPTSSNPERLEAKLKETFPQCKQPMEDIARGVRFWQEVMRIISEVGEFVNVTSFKGDMDHADSELRTRFRQLGLASHPAFRDIVI
eukprot:GHVU01229911.1.p2 GENE.GHVU01229911.1~~GHVU01229911.1.p2  ORF type:complete len:387 (+),score=61.29 GHVU01229911.1:2034-3194(+)